jgi:diaminopimelate decarboxylase
VPTTGGQAALSIEGYAAALGTALRDGCRRHGLAPLRLVIEPGRSIIARAGVALYRVIASKPLPADSDAARYLHLDGGMGDNIRPALYGAQYHAVLVAQPDAPADEVVHLAGRYCESGDVLIHRIPLPRAAIGDVVALASAGAYTLSMASNYNWVPRPPALLLRREGIQVLQRRETIDDMLAREALLAPME